MWGSKTLDELTYQDISTFQWQMKKAKTGVKFNRVLAALGHMYTMAMKMAKVDRSPVASASDLKVQERGRLRYMSAEVSELLSCCAKTPHLPPIVITALNTGARKSEILGLKVGANVDLDRRLIRLDKTKNGRERHIPINATLLQFLREQLAGKEPGDYVFARDDGSPFKDVRKSFDRAVRDAGIQDFHFHDLRHTFASTLVAKGVDLYVVKELMGHKTIRMTEKYAHLAPEHPAQAVSVLDQAYADCPGFLVKEPSETTEAGPKVAVQGA